MEFRENQLEAINQIIDYFDNGVKTVILNAPTGSGKTIINLFTGKEIGGAYYSTHLRVLVDQIKDDLSGKLYNENLGWCIMGRGAYKCNYLIEKEDERYQKDLLISNGYVKTNIKEKHEKILKTLTADGSPCTQDKPKYKYDGMETDVCPFLDQCSYYENRDKAIESVSTVTTLDYLLLGILPQIHNSSYNIGWFEKPLLVIDEAHYLPEKLCDFFSVNISKNSLPDFDYIDALEKIENDNGNLKIVEILSDYLMIQRSYLDMLKEKYNEGEDDPVIPYFKNEILLSVAISRQIKLVDRVSNMISNLSVDAEWIFNRDDNGIYWKPYSPKKFMEKFWKMFDHIILSSATFFGIEDYLDELGLSDNYRIINMESTFSPEKAPIISVSDIRLNKNNFNDNIDNVVSTIDDILSHENSNGIIHCQTYNYKNAILSRSKYMDRFIVHDSLDRSDKLKEFMNDKTDKVLLSVNMGEGIDLKDDLARFQIIVKAPYPFLGDPWTKIHFDRSKQWYNNQTVIQIMQMCGRIIRSKDDWGTTYLIDKNISDLLHRSELPQYFRDRLDAGLKIEQKRLDEEFDELFKL